MDIRLLWLFAMLIVWVPALFSDFDDVVIAIVVSFSIVLTIVVGYFWANHKWNEYVKSVKDDDKNNKDEGGQQ